MWYLGQRVALQHSSDALIVPDDPHASMKLDISQAIRAYGKVICRGGSDIAFPALEGLCG